MLRAASGSGGSGGRRKPTRRPRASARACGRLRVCALLVVAGVAGCSPSGTGAARPVVAVSVAPLQWLVDGLAGDRIDSVLILPPGASPASYEPTLAQRAALDAALLYVRVGHPGFPLEGAWLHHVLDERPELPVVAAADERLHRSGDPHVWLSPSAMRATAEAVAGRLGEVLPDAREEIDERRAAVVARIDAVGQQVAAVLEPVRGRSFWVFHPSWGTFASEFGLVQVAIEEDHKAPGLAQLAALTERARREEVDVIFIAPHFDASPARTLARAVGARVERLDPLAYQWDENLLASAKRLAEAMAP